MWYHFLIFAIFLTFIPIFMPPSFFLLSSLFPSYSKHPSVARKRFRLNRFLIHHTSIVRIENAFLNLKEKILLFFSPTVSASSHPLYAQSIYGSTLWYQNISYFCYLDGVRVVQKVFVFNYALICYVSGKDIKKHYITSCFTVLILYHYYYN